MAGAINGNYSLAASIAGTSDVSANLAGVVDLIATINATSSFSGNLAGIAPIEAIINGTSEFLIGYSFISAQIVGTSTIFGRLVNFLQDKAILDPILLHDDNDDFLKILEPAIRLEKITATPSLPPPPDVPPTEAIESSHVPVDGVPPEPVLLKKVVIPAPSPIIIPPPPLPPEDIPLHKSSIKLH
jgi:hypothetical protein